MRLLPFQRFYGDTNFPKDGFRQSADSRTQQGGGDLGIEILDAPKNIIVQLGRIAAAMENHIADTFTKGFLKPSGDTAVVQFFQKAVLLVVQQVGKAVSGGFLRKLPGKYLHSIQKRAIPV